MTPLVNLIDWEVAAVDFRIEGMLMAPAQAIPRLLARQDLEGRTARALGDPRGLRLATACEARRRAAFANGGAGSTAVAITSEQGLIKMRMTTLNQAGEAVQIQVGTLLVRGRAPASGT